jgi:hypothetical protein
MYTLESPYISIDDEIKSVTVKTSIDLKGRTAVLHNVGPDILYFSKKSTVSTDSPELAMGEKTFPRTGVLYLLSAGTSKLKIEYIEQA